MGPKLIHTVLMSPILHLRLNRAKFDKDLIEAFKNLGPGQHAGTLQTLDIELASEDLSRTPKGHSFDLVAQILKYCSSSLRTLRWNGYCTSVVPEGTSDVPEQLPTLPNIRDLTLSMLELRSPGDMEALLPLGSTSKLLRLELDHPDQYTVQHMNTMTAIPTLKELAISGGPRDTMPVPLSFFEANPQLELLSIESDQTDAIDNMILPLLASCFHNLISLEIEYAESKNEVSGTTLHYMKSLEKLHLQAGHRYGWKRTWVVDHPAIRQCVEHLPKLKYLALSRDTYHHDPDRRGDFEGYYTRPYLLKARNWAEEQLMNRRGAEEFDDFLADSALEWRFELIHRRRMLIKAYKYIHLRYEDGPHLEFLYFGELPVSSPLSEMLCLPWTTLLLDSFSPGIHR